MFRNWKSDDLKGYAQTALGAAIGSVAPAMEALWKAYGWIDPHVPIGLVGLLTIIVLFSSVVMFTVCWSVAKGRDKSFDEKIDEIRKRPKRNVALVAQFPVSSATPTMGPTERRIGSSRWSTKMSNCGMCSSGVARETTVSNQSMKVPGNE